MLYIVSLCLIFAINCLAAWSMDHEYNFLRFSSTIPPPSCFEVDDRTDKVLTRMLNRIRDDSVDELQILAFSPYTSDFERTMRLLYLFQRDFLSSRVGAKILDVKLFRDIFYQEWDYYDSYMFRYGGKNLSPNLQLTIILAFHLLFVVMGAYIFYFTYQMYRRLQEDWIASFIIFVGADMVIVAPLEVMFMHVFLPSLVYNDIQAIVKIILDYVERCKTLLATGHPVAVMLPNNQSVQTGATGKLKIQINSPSKPSNPLGITNDNVPSINSTQYFFTSNRVAQYFPDSAECKIVLSYTSIFPPGHDLPYNWLRRDNKVLLRNYENYMTAVNQANQALAESVSMKSKKGGGLSRKHSSRLHSIPEYLRNNRNRYDSYLTFKLPLYLLEGLLWMFLNLPFYAQETVVYLIALVLSGGIVYVHYYLSLYNIFFLAVPTIVLVLAILLIYLVGWIMYGIAWIVKQSKSVKVAPQPMDGIDADVENAEEYQAGMKAYHRSQVSSKSISRSIFEVADPQMENDADIYDSDYDDDVVVLNQPVGNLPPPNASSGSLWNVQDMDDDGHIEDLGVADIPTVRQDYNSDTGSPSIIVTNKTTLQSHKNGGGGVSRSQDNNRGFAVDDFDDDDDFGIDDNMEDDIDDIESEYSTRQPHNRGASRIKPNMRVKLRLNMKKVKNVGKFRPRK